MPGDALATRAARASPAEIRAEIERARARLQVSARALRSDLGVLDALAACTQLVRKYPYVSVAAAVGLGFAAGVLINRRKNG